MAGNRHSQFLENYLSAPSTYGSFLPLAETLAYASVPYHISISISINDMKKSSEDKQLPEIKMSTPETE